MKLFQAAVCALLLAAAQAPAQSIVVPAGIGLEPDKSLDITYQVIEAFDEKEKALAGWDGNRLMYVISVEKLPQHWTDPEAYFPAFARDYRDAGRTVLLKRSGSYKTASPLTGHYLEIQSREGAGDTVFVTQLLHFLTDGKTAWLGMATLAEGQSADRMLKETQQLFASTVIPNPATIPLPAPKTETPYFGTWKWTGPAPDGNPATGVVVLNDDLSFTNEVTVNGKVIFKGTGLWSIDGKRLLWNYLRSVPELPPALKEDEDEIVVLDGPRLVLRAKQSGRQREFIRP